MKITGMTNLEKVDGSSVINTDNKQYNSYIAQRKMMQLKETSEKVTTERINNLESEVSDIKNLLQAILEKVS